MVPVVLKTKALCIFRYHTFYSDRYSCWYVAMPSHAWAVIDAIVTQVSFQNGEFRITRRKLEGLAILVEKHIVYQFIFPSITPQGQRFPFSEDSARNLEQKPFCKMWTQNVCKWWQQYRRPSRRWSFSLQHSNLRALLNLRPISHPPIPQISLVGKKSSLYQQLCTHSLLFHFQISEVGWDKNSSLCVVGGILRWPQWVTALNDLTECGWNLWLASSRQTLTKVMGCHSHGDVIL